MRYNEIWALNFSGYIKEVTYLYINSDRFLLKVPRSHLRNCPHFAFHYSFP